MLFGHHELKTGKYGLSPPKRPWLADLLQKLLSGILLDALSRVCQAVTTIYALSQASPAAQTPCLCKERFAAAKLPWMPGCSLDSSNIFLLKKKQNTRTSQFPTDPQGAASVSEGPSQWDLSLGRGQQSPPGEEE